MHGSARARSRTRGAQGQSARRGRRRRFGGGLLFFFFVFARCPLPRRQRQGRRLLLREARGRRPHVVAGDRRTRQHQRRRQVFGVAVGPAAQGRALVEVREREFRFFFRSIALARFFVCEGKRWRRERAGVPFVSLLFLPFFRPSEHVYASAEARSHERIQGKASLGEGERVFFSLSSPLRHVVFCGACVPSLSVSPRSPLSSFTPSHPPPKKSPGPPRQTGPTPKTSSPSCSLAGPRTTRWQPRPRPRRCRWVRKDWRKDERGSFFFRRQCCSLDWCGDVGSSLLF